ncbi:MAG: PEGA domain-containing protein [Archangiaceae bacterium]|nr:PEGA domain-containing protein [Archangiaceae bacterium]
MKPLVFAIATLLPTLAFASPPPTSRRIAVLLVPMDKGAEAWSVRVESYMNEALKEYSGLSVKTSDDLFPVPADEDAEASLKRAETGFTESKAAFDKRDYEDAERKLRATIKEFTKAAAALKVCGHLCDAVAMYAASLQARGDVEEAKIATIDLLSLNPTFELDRKKYPADYIALRAQVATSRNAALRGTVQVKSKPAGARIYLDGDEKGHTPGTLQTLPIGKHLVRVARPGFKPYGTVVEVTPEEAEVSADLIPTASYKAYDGVLDKLAVEAKSDKGGSTMASIGKSLNLDRGVIVVLKEVNDSGGLEMSTALFELQSGKRLAAKRSNFQGDEYGQLKGEVGRALNLVMTQAEGGGEKKSSSSDPLDGRHGMDDWNETDRGGARTTKGSKSGDPLKGKTGMEDW